MTSSSAAERVAEGVAKRFALIADDGLARYGDAELIEAAREVKGIGVEPVGREQFGTDCDDFSFHGAVNASSGQPSTSQSRVKSASVVVSTARRVASSARPTRPLPLSAMSAWPAGVMRTMPRRPR